MLKISKLADYAVVILVAIAEHKDDLVSASTLSELTKLSEPTVAKTLKLLGRANIVNSVRGINGGYALSDTAENISIRNVISAVDGPISLTACSTGEEPDCSLVDCCTVRGRWNNVNNAICNALSSVTLADMMMETTQLMKKEVNV